MLSGFPAANFLSTKGFRTATNSTGASGNRKKRGEGGEAAPIDGLSGSITHFAADAVK